MTAEAAARTSAAVLAAGPLASSAFRAGGLLDVAREIAQGGLGLLAATGQEAGGDPGRLRLAGINSAQDDGGDRRAGRVEGIEAVAVFDQQIRRPFDLRGISGPRYRAHIPSAAQL